jgi:Tol biopolymer transport system component
MSDYRDLLEKTRRSFQPPHGGLEEIYRGRDRRRRRQRVSAGAVGLAIGLAVILAGSGVIQVGEQPIGHSPTTLRFGQIALTTDGSLRLIDPSTGNVSKVLDLRTGAGRGGYTVTGFTWSPEGTRFAYVTEQRGTVRVFDLETNKTSTIVPCDSPPPYHAGGCARYVAWSPDGSRIAVSGGRGLDLVDPDGSNPTTLIDLKARRDGFVGPATWSPDGSTIAFSGSLPGSRDIRAIYEVNADGTNIRVLLKQPGSVWVSSPRWSPDGSQIAYLVAAHTPGFAYKPAPPIIPQVWIIEADGSNPRLVFEGGSCCAGGDSTGLSWAPDGSKIAFIATPPGKQYGSGRPRLYAIDPLTGTAQVIATNMPFKPPVWQPAP